MIVPSGASSFVVDPTSISYVSTLNQEENGLGGSLNNEINLINGSGLSGTPDIFNYITITHDTVFTSGSGNAWATVDTPPGGGDYFVEGGEPAIFEIALGGEFTLDALVSWGYHFGGNINGNFMKTSTLEFSSNGGTSYHTTIAGLTTAIPSSGNLASTTSFVPVSANFVRLTVTDNHFEDASGGDRIGIAEIRFLGIPEPSVALLSAFSGCLLLRRRRD